MTLKVGSRGFLQLGANFEAPRWREAVVVGVQTPWLQALVRCSADEITKTGLSHVTHEDVTYCLVTAQFHQLTCGAPEAPLGLGEIGTEVVKLGVQAVVNSEEDMHYATATEPMAVTKKSKAKGSKNNSSSSSASSNLGEEDSLALDLQRKWLGAFTEEGKKSAVKRSSRSKKFALLEPEEKPKSKEAANSDAMVQAALRSGDPLQALLALQLSQQLEKRQRGRRSKERRSSRSPSSSSKEESSGSERGGKGLKGHARAVEHYQRTKRKMFKKPLHYVRKYVRSIEEELGSEETAYRLVDHNKKIAFGKQKNLQRCHYLTGIALEMMLREDYHAAALQLCLNLQAMHQAALDFGEWEVAWLLTHQPEVFKKRMFGGDPDNLQSVTAYIKSMNELTRSTEALRKKGAGKGDQGDQSEQKPGKGKNRGKEKKEKSAEEA